MAGAVAVEQVPLTFPLTGCLPLPVRVSARLDGKELRLRGLPYLPGMLFNSRSVMLCRIIDARRFRYLSRVRSLGFRKVKTWKSTIHEKTSGTHHGRWNTVVKDSHRSDAADNGPDD